MGNIFMTSVADISILNRDNERICSGKTLLDSAFERDTVNGGYIPLKKVFKMSIEDCLYFETKHAPYPERAEITCQIVSMETNRNIISHISFGIDNLHLYNDYSQVERILKNIPQLSLTYSDKYRKVINE